MDTSPAREVTGEKFEAQDEGFSPAVPTDQVSKRWYLRDLDLSPADEVLLTQQVREEIEKAEKTIKPWLERKYRHLKVYNNQARDDNVVGEPLLFTGFQTLLAATYDDQLSVMFRGRTELDHAKTSALNYTAEYDYDLMDKPVYDYYMRWNSLFFGRSIALMLDYDTKSYTPMPQIVDPLVLLVDPSCASINGKNIGAPARHFGFEVTLFKDEVENNVDYKAVDKINWGKGKGDSLQAKAREYRDLASAKQTQPEDSTDQKSCIGFRWFTIFNGKRVVLTVVNDKELVIRCQEINDVEFPVVEMCVFPTPNDFYGVTVPDLAEDKQRMKAVLNNLGIELLDANLHTKMAYNKHAINDPSQLSPVFEGNVEVDGDPRANIAPLQTPAGNLALYDYISNQLDFSVQRALATPEIQQGVLSTKERTLGELELVASGSNNRYSLMIKMMAIAEREFWLRWYNLHKTYFPDSVKKFVRISSPTDTAVLSLTRDKIVLTEDPDIDIESKTIVENRRLRALSQMSQFYPVLRGNPTVDARALDKYIVQLLGLKDDMIESLLPPQPEELLAREENLLLSQNRMPTISVTDDHQTHIREHEASADTPAKRAHILYHMKAMRIIKKESLSPAQAMLGGQQGGGAQSMAQQNQPQPGAPGASLNDGGANISV